MGAGLTHRDHGGGIDAAVARYGGQRADWLDLSTGINPVPYPVGDIPPEAWTALPDSAAMEALLAAARQFWGVPRKVAILAAPGASSLIARLPQTLGGPSSCMIQPHGYNEWVAAFGHYGWTITQHDLLRSVEIWVHPNNPDGVCAPGVPMDDPDSSPAAPRIIYDESFCDTVPRESHIALTCNRRVFIVKSFGKFWGLAGLRLGFLIGDPAVLGDVAEALGPWPVPGPAIAIGTRALSDPDWAKATRVRLVHDAARLDAIVPRYHGAVLGTSLFRLYTYRSQTLRDALFKHLARHRILTRVFPYSTTWMRIGLPAPHQWGRVAAAMAAFEP
ncbi:MAG: aminotransferase class I/II-fold pyridoxal phosphate-dependent enzyme [Rhodobacteraceae bacterium]|nr:aminotransferase class I/II-fold pyridoxal phosphate-dependent enzyme [Paracoccaceae bacterium]